MRVRLYQFCDDDTRCLLRLLTVDRKMLTRIYKFACHLTPPMLNRSRASPPSPTPAPPKASARATAMLSAKDDGAPPPPPAAFSAAVFDDVLLARLDADGSILRLFAAGAAVLADRENAEEEEETVGALKLPCQLTAEGTAAAFYCGYSEGADASVAMHQVSNHGGEEGGRVRRGKGWRRGGREGGGEKPEARGPRESRGKNLQR